MLTLALMLLVAQQDAPAPAPTPAIAAKPKKTCRVIEDGVSSRLNQRRVCKTDAEWEEYDARNPNDQLRTGRTH